MGRGHSGATKAEAQMRGVLIDSGLARGEEALNPWQKVDGSKRERLEARAMAAHTYMARDMTKPLLW